MAADRFSSKAPAESGSALDQAGVPFKWATVLGNVLSLSFGAGVSQTMMAVSAFLTARQLGAERFGEYAACFSTAGLAAILFNLGLNTWLLRNGARDSEQLDSLLGIAVAIKALVGIPWIGTIAIILPLLNPETFQPQLVFLSAMAIWLESIFTIGQSVFQVLLRNQVTALLLIGSRGGILLLTVLLALADLRETVTYAWVRLAVAAITVLVTALLLPVKPRVRSISLLLRAGRESLPFALSDLLTSVYVQADTTIAAIVLNKESVGLYAPASRLISGLFVIPNAGYSVMIPVLVRLIEAKKQSLNRMFALIIASSAVVGMVLWLGVWRASGNLPAFLLGSSFEKSGILLSILSPILFLKSCSFGAAAILVAVGWQNRRVYVQAFSAIVNVTLNLAIIHHLGIVGIARVYVLSESLLALGYLGFAVYWLRRFSHSPDA